MTEKEIGYANVITADDIDKYADYEPCKVAYIVKKNTDLIDRKVIEDIKAEIQAIEINGQVDEHTMFIRGGEEVKNMALKIIDKHISGDMRGSE